jgi:uncharacterized DUF497 family protein
MSEFTYEFEWDPGKANINLRKHGIDFRKAATVFLDPLAITIPDEDHSEIETRWVTMGNDEGGHYVLVVHTFEELTGDRAQIRLISARRPTRAEVRNYEKHQ